VALEFSEESKIQREWEEANDEVKNLARIYSTDE
jgi:hypothetical protein